MRLHAHSFWVALVALSGPAHAAESAVFCKGNSVFAERIEPSGSMTFKVIGANARQNIIEVAGVAMPHAGGWRYQVKSDKEPDDRCTIDIVPHAAGFDLRTFEGARCISSGGNGAAEILEHASFPGGTRRAGSTITAKTADDIPEDLCSRKQANVAAESPASATQQRSRNPEDVVKALIEDDRDALLNNKLPAKPDAFMQQRFTSSFNASWANAMSHNQEEPVLDGDVITGAQTVKRVILKGSAKSINGESGFVSTDVVYFDDEGPKKPHKQTVRFFLKKEDGVWKVDDINAGDQDSIRAYFKKSYGK